MLRKDDNSRQLVYYQVSLQSSLVDVSSHSRTCQAGLGTYTDPLLKMPIASKVSMALDQMLAWNLASHVKGISLRFSFVNDG